MASNGITAFNLGGVVGAIGGGLAFSRVGSRAAMLTMAAGAIAGAFALSLMTIESGMARLPLFALLTLSGGLINAVQTTMYALATNVYASAIRATGIGAAVSVGRIGAILSGYAGAWALRPRQRVVLRPDGRDHGRVLRDAEHRAAPRAAERPLMRSRKEDHMSARSHRIVDGSQPPLIYPPYKSGALRAPTRPLIKLTRDFSDFGAPVYGYRAIGEMDADLTRQHAGEPLGERIIVSGRVLDEDGRPVRNTLVELWQANAAGRYVACRRQSSGAARSEFHWRGTHDHR